MKLLLLVLLIIHLGATSQNLIPYRLKNLWGYCDTLGNVKIEPKFTFAHFFEDGMGKVEQNGKQSFVDKDGKLLFSFYDEIYKFNKDLAKFRFNYKLGLVNKNKIIIPALFDDIYNFPATVKNKINPDYYFGFIKNKQYILNIKNGKYFLYNGNDYGRLVPPRIRQDDEIKLNETDIFFEKILNTIELSKSYDSVVILRNNNYRNKKEKYFKTYLNRKVGLIKIEKDTKNPISILIEPLYEEIFYKNDDYVIARKGIKIGILKNYATIKYPFIYDDFEQDSEGWYANEYIYTFQDGLKGFLIYNSSYQPAACKYENVSYGYSLFFEENRIFYIFICRFNNKGGYVGENGVEYFKD